MKMVAIKGMNMPIDCKKCPLMGTDVNPKDLFSPMMCIAIWATTHEKKHCIGGKVRDDCPLAEIGTCKDCKHYYMDEDGHGYHCEKFDYTRFPVYADFYCADFEKRGAENE